MRKPHADGLLGRGTEGEKGQGERTGTNIVYHTWKYVMCSAVSSGYVEDFNLKRKLSVRLEVSLQREREKRSASVAPNSLKRLIEVNLCVFF